MSRKKNRVQHELRGGFQPGSDTPIRLLWAFTIEYFFKPFFYKGLIVFVTILIKDRDTKSTSPIEKTLLLLTEYTEDKGVI